ncbi:uncharacterized protein LOC107036371 [Diachasma alloeum]|uniref:uncharacterized protein LOC107036371 n=1 Tax=Diachasma alloeum TaxID=454923 RepID=UPI000738224C|nr:uncharacterized protein LOC107036371 [Diachasma alloeum]
MLYTSAIYLLMIGQIIAVKMRHLEKSSLETRLRELLDLPPLPERSLVLREDNQQDAEDQSVPEILENSPFERFNPIDRDSITTENIQATTMEDEDIWEGRLDRKKIERLRAKFKSHKIMISLPVACVIIICTVVITSCCTLYLRSRIVGCIAMIRPKKKLNKYLDIDPEVGRRLTRVKLLQQKPPSLAVPRARSLSYDYVHVATQGSTPSVDNTVDTAPTGCYTCCKKKKKGKKRKK